VEVEAQQVVRSLPDVDLGLTFPSFIKLAGTDPNGALVFEKPSNIYAIHWVTRTQDANDPRLARFIKIYNEDPEGKPLLTRLYSGQIGFGWWLNCGLSRCASCSSTTSPTHVLASLVSSWCDRIEKVVRNPWAQ
jgi:hypothetical protein